MKKVANAWQAGSHVGGGHEEQNHPVGRGHFVGFIDVHTNLLEHLFYTG